MDRPTQRQSAPSETTASGFPLTVVSVDVGGTKIACALLRYERPDWQPAFLWRSALATEAKRGGEAVLERIVDLVRTALDQASAHADARVAGIGVGTAGRVDAQTGSIAYANDIMPGWTGQPVRDRLVQEFSLPVAVLGDVQSHALGEARWGAARGVSTCLMMAPGTGLGGAVIAGGRVVRGAHGFAGEIGSTMNPLDVSDGTLESVASGSGIEVRYERLTGVALSGADISARASLGDHDAVAVIESAGTALGTALAGWVNILDPEMAVLSGSVTKAGPLWRSALERAYRANVPEVLADLPIVDATLGSDAPLVGAAENLLDSLSA